MPPADVIGGSKEPPKKMPPGGKTTFTPGIEPPTGGAISVPAISPDLNAPLPTVPTVPAVPQDLDRKESF